jgi:hypothetical protein
MLRRGDLLQLGGLHQAFERLPPNPDSMGFAEASAGYAPKKGVITTFLGSTLVPRGSAPLRLQ